MRHSRTMRLSLIAGLWVLCTSCETFWVRQDGNDANSAFISIASSTFQGNPSQRPIASQVIEAVPIGHGDQLLFVTTRARNFVVYNRAGVERCRIDTGVEFTAAPTIAGASGAFAGGYYGNVWSFNTASCSTDAGWPYKANDGAIVGPPLVFGSTVIVAAKGQQNRVVAISTQGTPSESWHADLPSAPTGSMALTPVKWAGAIRHVLLVATTSGGVVALDPENSGALLKLIPTGPLTAGVSIGSVGDQRVAVIPEYGPLVRAVNIEPSFGSRWSQTIVNASPSTARFESEASIANGSVFLTTGTHLVGLRLDDGQPKWPAPVDLLNSGGALRPASDNQDRVYVANGPLLQVYRGVDGTLIKSIPVSPAGSLNVRPSIARDGTVITGDAGSILQFH